MWLSRLGKPALFDVIRSSFAQLSKKDQRKIKQVLAAQIVLSFLDLLGIALIGLVATLAVTGINSKTPSGLIASVLDFGNLSTFSFQLQTAILASFALVVLISRSLLSMFFIKRTLRFLGKCGAEIAGNLFAKILTKPLSAINRRSVQEYTYSLTSGVETITIRIIGSSVTLLSDTTLLFFILGALFYVNFPMTVVVTLVVGTMAWILHRMTTARSKILGLTYSGLDITSRETLADALSAFREIASKGRLAYFENEFRTSRRKVSGAFAEYNFMPYMGKYVIETSIIIAAFLVAGAQFLLTDAANAITTLSIFMAAGSRLGPAVLRIQQGIVGLNNSWGVADSTLALIKEVESSSILDEGVKEFSNLHQGFTPSIELKNVSYRYPLSNSQTLKNLDIVINPGESIAIVGPSGSGKTTLFDLMMGLLVPESGVVTLSGTTPREAISTWPGSVGYVPQEIYLANTTVAENVALGFHLKAIHETEIWDALEKAQISKFISSLTEGLSTNLGERGIKLSGGQKQRLGIARALLTRPKILFLDEATSALDSQTENEVSKAIDSLKGEVTLVCIAHRLSTARRADRVFYLAEGKVQAQGSFEEVIKAVPDFEKQAELMDLSS